MSCAGFWGRNFRGRGESEDKGLETSVCGVFKEQQKSSSGWNGLGKGNVCKMVWERAMFVEDEAR